MKILDALLARWMEGRVAKYQSALMARHCEEVQHIYATMRAWRHDYHNHIQAMLALVDEPDELRAYLSALNDDLARVDPVLKTGNLMIDAILNSKLSLIRAHGVAVSARAALPPEVRVPPVDLCAIVGNLLDNALEACLRQGEEQERFIRVYMGVLKEQLYISVVNTMAGGRAHALRSEKGEGHGLGLGRVDGLVGKHGGFVNRQREEGVFATEILLPLPSAPFAP